MKLAGMMRTLQLLRRSQLDTSSRAYSVPLSDFAKRTPLGFAKSKKIPHELCGSNKRREPWDGETASYVFADAS